jgi:hypothetical protein
MEAQEEVIREAFKTRAAGFVITYRVEDSEGPRPSLEDPMKEVFSVRLSATVDAVLVREALETLIPDLRDRDHPSVALQVVRTAPQPGDPRAPLDAFENAIAHRLRSEGVVLVDPALRGDVSPPSRGFLELARSLGADLAIEIGVGWRLRATPRHVTGGVAEVRVRAVRVKDSFEIALSHFEAPAYHEDPEEAFARALEAVQGQVSENLVLQLGRNWEVLAKDDGPVHLRLVNVSSLMEVDAVRKALQNLLGAKEASLVSLAPDIAEMVVQGPLSPGALQERLVAVAFDDFRLHPVEVSRQRVELRVERAPVGNGQEGVWGVP